MNQPQTNPNDFEDPIDEEDRLRIEEERRAEKLQNFGSSLAKTRDEWISLRRSSGWDRRVREDIDQYNNQDAATKQAELNMVELAANGGSGASKKAAGANRSTVFIGMTRQKTNGAEARLADIIIPNDDKNFAIKPTPNPELVASMNDSTPLPDHRTKNGEPLRNPENGEVLTKKDLATREQAKADEAAKGMEREIDDQLTECDYKGELRKVIHDAAVMGTGVLKGPIVIAKTRKQWKMLEESSGVYQMLLTEDKKPASVRVDPRNIWEDPACGEDIQAGSGIFERDLKTAKQIRALAKQPGYMKSQLRLVLEEGPKQSAARTEIDDNDRDPEKNCFEVWEYWGEINREDAIAAGINVSDDILDTVDACVVMVNNTVVKAFLSPLDSGELPYDFLPWEKEADKCRGVGVPRLMNSQQRVMNAAWRAMMDNAGMSSGPMIVVRQKGFRPQNGIWEIKGNKIWIVDDDTLDVNKIFATFNIPNMQQYMAGIIQLATQLADEETSVPMIMQGNERAAPETVGGMQMLMNASNVVLRRLVKQVDDMITKPHMRRYYDFNMLYSKKQDIKGDFDVDARGASALLVRDIQNQAFLNLLAAAANPVFSKFVDPKKIFKKAVQAQHVDPAEIMFTEAEIKANEEAAANAPQEQNPQLQVAQIRTDGDLKKAELVQASDMKELELKLLMAREDREFQREMKEMTLNIEMVKLAQTKELTLDQIKAKLAESSMKERNKKELYNAEAQLRVTTGAGI
jgi:hypothetical protein